MADSLSLDFPVIKRDLLRSRRECSLRGLRHSAKWAAELAYMLRNVEASTSSPIGSLDDSSDLDEGYHLSKGYLDLQEYDRAAFLTKDAAAGPAQFLHYYARYLSDEKKRLDDVVDPVTATNPGASRELKDLQVELKAARPKLDGFGLYIYGVVLKRLQLRQLAIDVLVEAVCAEPLHWGAWVELSPLIKDRDHLLLLDLPDHWIKHFFLGHVFLELQLSEEALRVYKQLQQGPFQDSPYIMAQVAVAHHNLRELDKAIEGFQALQQVDPYRLDNMDVYSNLLYVRERRDELALLAHRTSATDKYRPETCCIVGNFYSLRKQHEKAVLYFGRALRLNPNYFPAWTLMGHEYMEMKNTKAAIQAYRRAVEVNPRDHRAWYGLGQTYELLKMPAYCLYYYRLAQGLHPIDPRMTIALGEAYEKLDKQQEAKKCFWRARSLGDFQGLAVSRLARVYERLGEHEQAYVAFTDYVRGCDGQVHRAEREELAHACCFLAKHHLARGQLEGAHEYARRCTEFPETREEAKSLLKQVAEARTALEQDGGAVDMQIEDDDGGDSLLASRDLVIAEVSDMDIRTPNE
ncbi:cell division cycle protein 23 homolog isoform X1 [Haemaphysalis longicornis]